MRRWLVPRPGLFERLGAAGRVVHVSAPAGSGKTFLLRSWIAAAGLSERTAWVSVGRQEHDAQAFWLSVLDSLRGTRIGSERVRELTAAPHLDGANVVGRLVEDLSSLREPLWLVIDDLHELQAEEAIRQVEVLLGSAPAALRFVLVTRRDLRLGLHRLRVEGELTEIRGEDLRFTLEESRALLEAAGVRLSDGALESLVARTEGWAAGLRLVALSLARHPDPERFAVSFSGRERAVADFLLAEVLERQSAEVRQLLLRTSLPERVSGPLADRLTGSSGSERILMELEDAGAFVVAVDPERAGFATTTCLGICSRSSCGGPPRRSCPACTRSRPSGGPSTGIRSRRFATRRRPRTGAWRRGCSRTTGSGCTWMGGSPPAASFCPGFPPTGSRPIPSWRCSPRATSGRRGPCVSLSGT